LLGFFIFLAAAFHILVTKRNTLQLIFKESQRLEQIPALLGFVVLIRFIISAVKSTVTSFLRNAYHTETQILDTDMHIEALLFL